ncbi:MAG: phosphoribosylanthranilate isomerase [Promethearchaeota archaeon]
MIEYVKICGLKNPEDIKVCIENGATAVGFIYKIPTSPRNLEKSELKNLLKQIGNKILTVVVLKPLNYLELMEIMKEIDASYFQIHINFNTFELDKLSSEYKKKLILASKVNKTNTEIVINRINKYSNQFFGFLIDNSEGQGSYLNPGIVKNILKKTHGAKVIIAGGITIKNIESILNDLKPYGIDASSSLESEIGVKDPIKIQEFLKKIKKIKKKIGG